MGNPSNNSGRSTNYWDFNPPVNQTDTFYLGLQRIQEISKGGSRNSIWTEHQSLVPSTRDKASESPLCWEQGEDSAYSGTGSRKEAFVVMFRN